MKLRPYNYWFFTSKLQSQKPFPENCVCDKCMLFFKSTPRSPLELSRTFSICISAKRVESLCTEEIHLTPSEEFELHVFGRWPIKAWRYYGKWYRRRSVQDVINAGLLDVTGEFVDIVFNKPLVIHKGPVYHTVQFCMMVEDENGNWCYARGYHPDEIKARFENRYPVWEP